MEESGFSETLMSRYRTAQSCIFRC